MNYINDYLKARILSYVPLDVFKILIKRPEQIIRPSYISKGSRIRRFKDPNQLLPIKRYKQLKMFYLIKYKNMTYKYIYTHTYRHKKKWLNVMPRCNNKSCRALMLNKKRFEKICKKCYLKNIDDLYN